MSARRIIRRKLSRPARLSFGLCRRPSRRGLRPPAVDYLWRGRPFLSLCLSLRESCLALHLLCFASWSSPLSQFLTSRISSADVFALSLASSLLPAGREASTQRSEQIQHQHD